MEPILTAFVAALLGGWSDKTQAVAALLSARHRIAVVLPALVIAAAVNSSAAAFGGMLLRLEVTPHGATLLLAIALVFAGVAGLIGEKPKEPKPRRGGFPTALASLVGAGWGDKSQYVIGALAAYYGSFAPVAAAGFAGTLAVCLPAVAGGEAFARAAPLKALRLLFAAFFLLAGAVVLLNALRLI